MDLADFPSSNTAQELEGSGIRSSTLSLGIRILLAWIILIAALGSVGFRLYQLQIVQGGVLASRAQSQQNIDLKPFIPRRPLVDRNGNLLAVDQPAYTLYAHPKLFTITPDAMATHLAPFLESEREDLLQRFKRQETGIPIAYDLPEEIAIRIQRTGLNGLDFIQHPKRLYPYEELFAQIIGYVDIEQKGQAGLEANQELYLRQELNAVGVNRMGNGALMPDNVPEYFTQQDLWKLQLTLDNRLQRVAHTALAQQLRTYSANRGAVIVMDVNDGSILAMVTLPTYNPNRYYEADVNLFRNWAVSDLYEPGSTLKPINVAIALEVGAIQPYDAIYDEGRIQIGGWPIENHDFTYMGGRGILSITEVLEHSSNVGMVHIMQRLKPETYYDWLQKLEIEAPLGTDLPHATVGELKNRETMLNSSVEVATASFGQGLAITPLKMLQLNAALANGGKLVTPHVIVGLIDSDHELRWVPERPEPRSVFSPDTTQAVLAMMESVVTNGTGESAAIEGYRIAGKTGTAQKAEYGTYIPGAKITSFVGILTVDNPRYVVFAVIDEPKGEDAFGSTVAAPIVKQVMETLAPLSLNPRPIQAQ